MYTTALLTSPVLPDQCCVILGDSPGIGFQLTAIPLTKIRPIGVSTALAQQLASLLDTLLGTKKQSSRGWS